VKGPKSAPSSRQANTRLSAGVRLSLPANVNDAVVSSVSPVGPLTIPVSGGVLSTITTRVLGWVFPARSAATADSVWVPSTASLVFHVAVAVTVVAGGAGVSVAVSDRTSEATERFATPLAASVARAWTVTVRRTNAAAGGARNTVAGAV